MKVLFVTNLPSPYRVDFFNELGKLAELTVIYERSSASDRNEKWKSDKAVFYKEVFINARVLGTDRSLSFGVISEIKKCDFDYLILSGYSSPSVMLAIAYCRIKKIPYYIESDGGFYKKDRFLLKLLKKFLLLKASGYFVSCEQFKTYLLSLGIDEAIIYKYNFTSLRFKDIISTPITDAEKLKIRQTLSLKEERIILTVGQFIKRKGFDILIKAAERLSDNTGVYFVGGNPIEEYIALKEKLKLDNVHFVGFKSKEELKEYYKAADVFVLPTREDVWGLVINESMACGLPVITTDRCIAGLELVKNGNNGYIVPVNDVLELAEKINQTLANEDECKKMGQNSISVIRDYTIENMALRHFEMLKELQTVE